MHTHTDMHTCARTHTCAHMYTQTCTHVYTYTWTHIRTQTCTHRHTHMHTNTCTHRHAHTRVEGVGIPTTWFPGSDEGKNTVRALSNNNNMKCCLQASWPCHPAAGSLLSHRTPWGMVNFYRLLWWGGVPRLPKSMEWGLRRLCPAPSPSQSSARTRGTHTHPQGSWLCGQGLSCSSLSTVRCGSQVATSSSLLYPCGSQSGPASVSPTTYGTRLGSPAPDSLKQTLGAGQGAPSPSRSLWCSLGVGPLLTVTDSCCFSFQGQKQAGRLHPHQL